MRRTWMAAGLLLSAVPLAAQSARDLAKAAATITEADVKRRVFIIADDSMRGRDTPSPGLEMTAQYVANEFQRFGLKPNGENGTWFVRLPLLRRQLLASQSVLTFSSADGSQIALPFSSSARILDGSSAAIEVSGGVVLVSSGADARDLKPGDFKDKIVVWPLDLDKLPPGLQAAAGTMVQGGVKVIVVVTPTDSATFAGRLAGQRQPRVSREGEVSGGGPIVLEVPEREITSQFPAAAQNFGDLRAAPTTVVQPLPDWTGNLTLKDSLLDRASAPVVVGRLDGRDKKLAGTYVAYSAHMDHIGVAGGQCQAMGADSICNGADDDGSGTVGVVELAEAFSQKKARPRRSMLFIGVSGEEKGLWG
ncbi:MAG TPA: M28 family peptidase, partial [Gemmatimonadales bacterium]|nr:M28 family peptidase [Gemmatimonadales bacterium]